MINLADPLPSAIFNMWLPRSTCVACLHCARGFAFLALACPSVQADGTTCRFFVQRRALPECLLLDFDNVPESEISLSSISISKNSTAAPHAYPAQVHAVVEELFELTAAQVLQWSLAAMLTQAQSIGFNEPKPHLLLLPDVRLSHFPFESLPALKRLFGHRITRDFSLHMFARRMQHHDAPGAAQPKRTIAEMHTGFARESLLLLPEAVKYPNASNLATSECERPEEDAQLVLSGLDVGCATAKDLENPCSSLPKTISTPTLSARGQTPPDWRSAVLAELSAFKKPGSTEGIPAMQPSSSAPPELLCSKNPQAAWALSLDRLVLEGNDLNSALARMDLTHVSLLGLLSMRKEGTSSESNPHFGPRRGPAGGYRHQTVAGVSEGVQTLLVLSTRGIAIPYSG